MKTEVPLYLPWKYDPETGQITSSARLDVLREVTHMDSVLGPRVVLAVNHFDAMLEALQECDDYLDNRADVVDGPDNRPMPNAAMSLQARVRAVLDQIEKGQP